jgi:hypothetical protein
LGHGEMGRVPVMAQPKAGHMIGASMIGEICAGPSCLPRIALNKGAGAK